MWLLNVHTRRLESFHKDDVPPYAILSHRWETDEITFREIGDAAVVHKKGYRKIDLCCKQAFANHQLNYVWVDTCCIDKSNSSELSEAINSMYKWYANAKICYAYLSDVRGGSTPEFEQSAWFTRGWTLQELLAPKCVLFYDHDWNSLGSKEDLCKIITERTGIPRGALQGFCPSDYSVADRMSWVSMRQTSREEDLAYCLLGIFGVNMPLIYGEGRRAFMRLQEEILRVSEDLTILAWQQDENPDLGVLAASPASFTNQGQPFISWRFFTHLGLGLTRYRHQLAPSDHQGITISSAGVAIELYLIPYCFEMYLAPICEFQSESQVITPSSDHSRYGVIIIRREWPSGYFRRVAINSSYLFNMPEGIDLYAGQFRQAIFSRSCVEQISNEKLSTVENYGFFIHKLSAEYSDFIKTSHLQENASSTINGPISLMSQTPFSQDIQLLSIRPGSAGIAGKVCFDSTTLNSVHLYFGFDFDFNPFCLAIHLQQPHNKGNEEQSEDLGISVRGLRSQSYLLESTEDMINLATEMRKDTRKVWTLQHDNVEFRSVSWKNERCEFRIQGAIIRLTKWSDECSGYSVRIQPAFPTTHERKVKDKWYVSPWKG